MSPIATLTLPVYFSLFYYERFYRVLDEIGFHRVKVVKLPDRIRFEFRKGSVTDNVLCMTLTLLDFRDGQHKGALSSVTSTPCKLLTVLPVFG